MSGVAYFGGSFSGPTVMYFGGAFGETSDAVVVEQPQASSAYGSSGGYGTPIFRSPRRKKIEAAKAEAAILEQEIVSAERIGAAELELKVLQAKLSAVRALIAALLAEDKADDAEIAAAAPMAQAQRTMQIRRAVAHKALSGGSFIVAGRDRQRRNNLAKIMVLTDD